MDRWRRVALGLVLVLLLMAPVTLPALPGGERERAAESPLELRASADSFTNRAKPRRNFGERRYLKVVRRPRARSYVSFDMRNIDRPIVSATLMIYARTAGRRGVVVRDVEGTWKERRIKHRNAPPRGDVIGRHRRHGGARRLNIDVTKGAIVAGDVFDVVLVSRALRATRYAARESAKGPRLEVMLADEPLESPSPSPSPSPPPSPSPSPPGSVRVAAGGDIACDPEDPNYNEGNGTEDFCRMRYTSDLLVDGNYDAVLIPGDVQYEDGDLEDFNVSYDPTWGRVKHVTYPVPGNHEYHTPGAPGYYSYFGSGNPRPSNGNYNEGYYSFELGAWHVIGLNSNCDIAGCATNSPQVQWLRDDLDATDSSCIMAFWHHPRWSGGQVQDDIRSGRFVEALYDHGADIIVVGHGHYYERYARQDPSGVADPAGIAQFTVGTGGKSLYPIDESDANRVAHQNDTYGILDLTLRHDGYDFEFVPEAGKTYNDRGSGSC